MSDVVKRVEVDSGLAIYYHETFPVLRFEFKDGDAMKARMPDDSGTADPDVGTAVMVRILKSLYAAQQQAAQHKADATARRQNVEDARAMFVGVAACMVCQTRALAALAAALDIKAT